MVFIAFYLVTSIIAGDFYKIPITVAFMVSSIYAIAVFRGKPLKQRVNLFSRGAATEQMMLMIWIFVLAGAFAHAAKAMGCIDATVKSAFERGFEVIVPEGTNSTFDNDYMTGETTVAYYNEDVWDGVADLPTFEEAMEMIEGK